MAYQSLSERNKRKSIIDVYTPSAKADLGLGVNQTDLEGAPYEESLFDKIEIGVTNLWDTGSDFLTKAFGGSGSSSSKSDWFDLKNIGSIAQGVGSIWDAYASSQYKKDIVEMEKDRVAREVAKQDKAQKSFDSVWS
jgi:hypothetical protein